MKRPKFARSSRHVGLAAVSRQRHSQSVFACSSLSQTATRNSIRIMLYRWWLSLERCFVFNLIRLFRIRRQSEKVARGFAIGFIVNFFPTFGFGVLISGFIAKVFGGNAVAGLVGGASMSFFWPLLFYFNMRTGGLFVRPPVVIDDLEDITDKTMDALVWGQTFTIGAVVNSLLAGLCVYLLLRLLHRQIRPGALAYFRRHARDHQRRFRRPRQPAA